MSLLSVNMLLMMESRHFENLNWRTLWLYPELSSISQIESTGMEREFIILNNVSVQCYSEQFDKFKWHIWTEETGKSAADFTMLQCWFLCCQCDEANVTELGDWSFVPCNASCLISSFYKFNIFFWYEMSPWHRARVFHSCWYVRYRKAIKIFCWLNNDATNL